MNRFLSGLLIFVCIAAPALAKNETQELKERIERLENRIQALEKIIDPLEEDLRGKARTLKFRKKFEERMKRDERIYEPSDLREIEKLYQTASQKWNSVVAKESLKVLEEEYPESNRAGCGVLYLGQMHMGKQKRDYLKKAIQSHADCWYGDGVQVGAYARFLLAVYYEDTGDKKEAKKLFNEILNKYPEAIDHKGNMLKDIIRGINK